MRDTDKLHIGLHPGNLVDKRPAVERIANGRLATGGKPLLRPRPHESGNLMSAADQLFRKPAAHVACDPGDEHLAHLYSPLHPALRQKSYTGFLLCRSFRDGARPVSRMAGFTLELTGNAYTDCRI